MCSCVFKLYPDFLLDSCYKTSCRGFNEREDATVATEDSPRTHVDEQVWPSVYLTGVNKL